MNNLLSMNNKNSIIRCNQAINEKASKNVNSIENINQYEKTNVDLVKGNYCIFLIVLDLKHEFLDQFFFFLIAI